MVHKPAFIYSTVLAGSLVIASIPVAAKMYRWIDTEGRVFYSDQVPPQQSKLQRDELNKNARVVHTIKAAKTEEQLFLEKRLALLRKEQETIIHKKKSYDKVLLSTFRNVEDLRMTLATKLASIDAQKRLAENSLVRSQENLVVARKKAAKAERSGRKVPLFLLKEIDSIEDSIRKSHIDIAQILTKRKAVQRKFDRDIARFIFLTKSKVDAQQLSNDDAESTTENALGLFNCKDNFMCDRAWKIARQFVVLHSTTKINYDTDTLIMSSDPISASDLSLSVSKSEAKQSKVYKFSLFLDIRCHHSTLGDELCQSEQVKNIRRSFKSYIENHLKN